MSNTYPHPIIAHEGWPYLGGVFIAALVVRAAAGFGWTWPLWILTLFVLQFLRDPAHAVPTQVSAILSPADGRIIAVEQICDPCADHDALRASTFMSVSSVHSNRAPVDDTAQQVQYFPGKFVNADLDKASFENERNVIVLHRADDQLATSMQVVGSIARHIPRYTKTGETSTRDQRYGFIHFGSRIDVYLSLTVRPRVTIGKKVPATLTVLTGLDWPEGRHTRVQPAQETFHRRQRDIPASIAA